MGADWDKEMMAVNAALNAALARLRDVMSQLSMFGLSEETRLDELSVYQQLLQFETSRLSVPHNSRRATVTERATSSRRSTSAATVFGRASYSSSSTMKASGSFSRASARSSRSSQYSKVATPEATLDYPGV